MLVGPMAINYSFWSQIREQMFSCQQLKAEEFQGLGRSAARIKTSSEQRSGQLVEKSLGHLDVARHSDIRVNLQRFAEYRLRFFAIIWHGAID